MSERASATTSVLIVEDHLAIAELIARYVAALPSFAVVGQAATLEAALALAEAHRPTLVVLDWFLANGLGLDFLRLVRTDPPPHVLVFSANTTSLAIGEALAAGARGYVEKAAGFSEFAQALHAVARGEIYLSPSAARAVHELRADSAGLPATLSVRERDVLRLMAAGLSSKQIGERLALSARTIENHRASIARRTGLHSIAELTLHAVRLGLVEVTTPHAPAADAGAHPPP